MLYVPVWLNVILIPSFGIMGAVAATALSYVIVVVVRIVDTKKLIKLDYKPGFLLINSGVVLSEVIFIIFGRSNAAIISAMVIIGLNAGRFYYMKVKSR